MSLFKRYYQHLREAGILNFENMQVSGESNFLKQYLKTIAEPIVFDVGANVGGYTKAALEVCPSAKIYGFEPHPLNFAKLARNLEGTSATLFRYALGDSDDVVTFYDRSDKYGSAHASLYSDVIEVLHRKESIASQVAIKRLDDVAVGLGVQRIHLLKIDTEGHELAVLKGAERMLRSGQVDVIQFEFNETCVIARTFFRDFWDFLPGYRFYRLLPDGAIYLNHYYATFCEVFAFQNIVCVRGDIPLFENAERLPPSS
jgi:FkbM family methyltransferase